jgi:hypothetical protein
MPRRRPAARQGWRLPAASAFPTGAELVARYLEPLAATPELAAVIETGARVTAISAGPGQGREPRAESSPSFWPLRRLAASAAIWRAHHRCLGHLDDARSAGGSGLPAEGEAAFSDRIAYGIPDILGRSRDVYAGMTTLVVGSGHSAGNALLELTQLANAEPQTSFLWATRSTDLARIYGGGDADQLPARGELGREVRELAESGRVTLVTGFSILALHEEHGRIIVEGETMQGRHRIGPVDRIIAATGQRPDLSLTRELRLDLDPWLEAPKR